MNGPGAPPSGDGLSPAAGRRLPRLDGLRGVAILLVLLLTVETLLAVLVFGGVLVARPTPVVRALDHPGMVWLGRLLYSIYLWQQLFLVRSRAAHGSARELPVALLGIAGAAFLSYVGVERPALAHRARWARLPELRIG